MAHFAYLYFVVILCVSEVFETPNTYLRGAADGVFIAKGVILLIDHWREDFSHLTVYIKITIHLFGQGVIRRVGSMGYFVQVLTEFY